MGKAYTAAGQAGGCLHTMAVLQAYQADLLIYLDEGEDIKNYDITELCRATDLSLQATKETARPLGVHGSPGGHREAFVVDPVSD